MSRLTRAAPGPRTPPTPARELTAVSADGARVHVEVHGVPDAPPVVLAHGWTCNTAFWAHQLRDLGRDLRVIAYDQRGHGRTPLPHGPDGYGTRALADDLTAVLDATLAPGERALLAGHSMGGMTIMAAADRPAVRDRTAAVLLCSTSTGGLVRDARVVPLPAGRQRTRLTSALLRSGASLGPVNPLGNRMLRYLAMSPGTAPERVTACARIVHACRPEARQGWSDTLDRLDLDAVVPLLTAPTAVLVGTDDRLTPPAHARRLAAALPHCTGLTELAGVGHMTPLEAPEAVTAAIRRLARAHLRPPS
ncbi:alpha/beta fold hydrolase [Streptomyces sp. JNUCC 64]